MQAIIIGAGRGSRLQHRTDAVPKTLVEVLGKPMLEHILLALEHGGFRRQDVWFIAGYKAEVVRERYPELRQIHNPRWEHNNILGSLLCAREQLRGGFVATYADIVYEGDVVRRLLANPAPFVLGCDTAWRRRYVDRHQHPETDAEKLRAEGGRVVELSRRLPSDAATGEFIGVMKASAAGAATLIDAYDAAAAQHPAGPYREGRSFERAYLIDLLAELLERGVVMEHEDTHGGYMELDTLEDLAHGAQWWSTRPAP